MDPQAALEAAVVQALVTKLGYVERTQARRCFDGQPHAVCGPVFVSVWSDGRRASNGRPNLDEVFAVNVTVTVRAVQPFDRWLAHRDDLQDRVDAIAAYVNADATDFRVVNAANVLAGFRRSGDTSRAATAPVGFCEGLCWEGTEPVRPQGPEWFHADLSNPAAAERHLGFSQTARFGRARRLRAALTAG